MRVGNPNLGKAAIAAGTTFSKDRQPLNPGRKKSKIAIFAKENDLSNEDINRSIKLLIDMTATELKRFYEDEKQPTLLRGFAGAMAKDIQRGSLQNLITLLERSFGKPKENIEHSGGVALTLSQEEMGQEIELLYQKRQALQNFNAD